MDVTSSTNGSGEYAIVNDYNANRLPDSVTDDTVVMVAMPMYHIAGNMILLFFLAQRAFVEGVTLTGVKG